ncbi:MAG TPA: phage tail sheath subtilisin-like domain-containing protein [Polyangiaceae bacterium]|nr:phage tail sheath subtilisin-like domain-containing protein [Polyangiaceae bacterium]
MAQYLSPGVYIEEVSYRSTRAIAGVGTTTTGFIGPTRFGPVNLELVMVSTLGEYEQVYGDGQPLLLSDPAQPGIPPQAYPNFMWQAARAFFAQGGQLLYVSRIVGHTNGVSNAAIASAPIGSPGGPTIYARYPGAYGNMPVAITVNVGQNVLRFDKTGTAGLGSVEEYDVVMLVIPGSPGTKAFYLVEWDANANNWFFTVEGSASTNIPLARAQPGWEVHVLTLTLTVTPTDPTIAPQTWAGLALDSRHMTSGSNDSLSGKFGADPHNREFGRELSILFDGASLNGLGLLSSLFAASPTRSPGSPGLAFAVETSGSTDAARTLSFQLGQGVMGTDGTLPALADYEGTDDEDSTPPIKTGLAQFEDVEDISIVAAPGSTYEADPDKAVAIMQELITHCETMRYRIAVLDSINHQSINDVRQLRAQLDTSYAALYYPWVRVMDPITSTPINLPPSGFVAGIYARNDVTRAVYKAPANEVVNLALGFEANINKAQQDILNPEGINCFRFFEGRGYRLWGARTVSSDTDWNYVNLRRYFAYLERSIDIGTQWAVFEPNGDRLWAKVAASIASFLLAEWQAGALLGAKPEQAFFVKCDRTTMTQNDIDLGRLVCQVGVAALRPAEFVIFRVGQWTGDRSS